MEVRMMENGMEQRESKKPVSLKDKVRQTKGPMSLKDKMLDREEQTKKIAENRETAAINQMSGTKDGSKHKSKQISAKVYPTTWALFQKINELRGVSTNSQLNILISDYVRENLYLMEAMEKVHAKY